MSSSVLGRLLNWNESPLVPHFRYDFKADTQDLHKSFANIKSYMRGRGGQVRNETENSFVIEIPASKVVSSLRTLPDALRIEVTALGPNQMQTIVTSLGDRKLYLSFLFISVAISILGILKKGELFALIFPLGTYGIVLKHSVYPQHPAHKRIRDFIKSSDQDFQD